MQIPFLIAMLSLQTLLRKTLSTTISFENASPSNTWILKSTGDSLDYITTHYNFELLPGHQEKITLDNNATKNFIYDVCDSAGPAAVLYIAGIGQKCAIYSNAAINITISIEGVTVKPIENAGIQNLLVANSASPYLINATTVSPPTCDLPYATQYSDNKIKMISFEGATLETPIMPNVCDLDYFAQQGFNAIELFFKWEYLQDFLGQDIPISWALGGYGAQLLYLIDAWTAKNYTVTFAMYNRMRYGYCVIGASDCWVSAERYANTWGQIATQLANNSHVIFGLIDNSEGENIDTNIILNNQNLAELAIRDAGATSQTILRVDDGAAQTPAQITDSFSARLLCAYASVSVFFLALLYFVGRYNNAKTGSSLWKNPCGIFGRRAAVFNGESANDRQMIERSRVSL